MCLLILSDLVFGVKVPQVNQSRRPRLLDHEHSVSVGTDADVVRRTTECISDSHCLRSKGHRQHKEDRWRFSRVKLGTPGQRVLSEGGLSFFFYKMGQSQGLNGSCGVRGCIRPGDRMPGVFLSFLLLPLPLPVCWKSVVSTHSCLPQSLLHKTDKLPLQAHPLLGAKAPTLRSDKSWSQNTYDMKVVLLQPQRNLSS